MSASSLISFRLKVEMFKFDAALVFRDDFDKCVGSFGWRGVAVVELEGEHDGC